MTKVCAACKKRVYQIVQAAAGGGIQDATAVPMTRIQQFRLCVD
jgi:hypothetical protein